MNQSQITIALKNFSFFNNLTGAQIDSFAKLMKEKTFTSKELLIELGDTSDLIYFVLSGLVKVYLINDEGKEINLAVIGPYETIGEIAVFMRGERTAYCEALENVSVLILQGEDFRAFLNGHNDVALSYLKYFAERLIAANKHIEEITSMNLKDRTLLLLANLSKKSADHTVELTQETLATILSATRPRVSEVIKELEKDGVIAVLHRKIKVL